MFKPQLKRASLYSTLSESTNNVSTSSRVSERLKSKNKEESLVPEAFLQESKSLFFRKNQPGLTGTLNTSEYGYPKAVEDEITNDAPGSLELLEEIFCFYKLNNIYFWQQNHNDLAITKKMVKHTFEEPITAVFYKRVLFKDFGDEAIMLIAIAFGTIVKLFRLKNFEKENNLSIAYLDDLMISIYSPEVVTNIKIVIEEEHEDYEKNSLFVLIGDANAKLILFDFKTKRKHSVDSIQEKIKRKVQKQTYTEIVQMIPYRQYVICLVKKHYESETLWKMLQKLVGNHKANVQVEQKIEIYKIGFNVSDHGMFNKSAFTNFKITTFSKYGEFATENIVNKIRSSFSKFIEHSNNGNNAEFGDIESMSLKNDFIQLMFRSGVSILVDQDLSFAETPIPSFKKPHNLAIITKNHLAVEEEITEKSVLLRSVGTNMMIFKGFIGSQDKNLTYVTPYLNKESSSLIRSIKTFESEDVEERGETNNKFIVFGLKSMTLVQKVDLKLAIFIYSMALEKEFPFKKYVPQPKKFEEKLESILEYYGEVEVIVTLLELLMKVKLYDNFKMNVRIDLFELAVKELSTDTELTFKEALKLYEENDKSFVKNSSFEFNKNVEAIIWKIILKCEKVKVEMPTLNIWHLKHIEAICMGIQVTISEIFKGVKDWTPKKFCFHRNEVYRIISYSKILIELIDVFVRKEVEGNSRRSMEINEFLCQNNKNILSLMQSGQSLKIKFCLLSKATIEKLTLLLKVYDYICEMNLHGTEIPKFSDLLFNSNQSHRLSFSNTILKTLGINNEALIEKLNADVPELKLNQVRKYNQWIESKSKDTGRSNDENNETFENSFEEQIVDVNEFLNQENYEEVKKVYLTPKVEESSCSNMAVKEISSLDNERAKSLQLLNGTVLLLRICLKKIQELRQEEIKTFNVISLYEKSNEDYFGILEIPSLEIKAAGLLKEVQYFTKSCEELLDQVFEKYNHMLISKESILSLLEAIKGELTIEVRRNIQNNLAKADLSNISESVSRRQLFSKNKIFPQKDMPSQSTAEQLSNEILRKFQ